MIRLVIFDVGGVILHYTEEMYIDYLHRKLGIDKKRFARVFLPLVAMTELGRLDVQSMVRIVADRFNVTKGQLEWDGAYRKLARVDMRVAGLVNRMCRDGRYKVVLLSDINESRYNATRKLVLNRLHADRVFLSFRMKMRKQDRNPERRPFRYVLRKMGVRPAEALFVDDRQANVDGAEQVGINGIKYRGYGDLAGRLRKMGVL